MTAGRVRGVAIERMLSVPAKDGRIRGMAADEGGRI